MAIQEVFKLFLDGSDFDAKIRELSKHWEIFAKDLTSQEIKFNVNDSNIKRLSSTISKETANIAKFADQIGKAFPNEIKFKTGSAVADIQKELEKVLKAAQERLDANPLNLLKQVKKDLTTLQQNQKAMSGDEVLKSRKEAAEKIATVEGFAGKRFTAAFGNADSLGKQIKLLTTRITELGEGSTKAAKDAAGLPVFVRTLQTAFDQINKSASKVKHSQEELDFLNNLKGFSPAFINSLEQFAKLTTAKEKEDVKVKPKVLEEAQARFVAAAKLDRKRLLEEKKLQEERLKVVTDGSEATLREGERAGKAVLELVKRVGFKITEVGGDTFRPLGEAVTDFSKSAEDGLDRAKKFQAQAAQFKVPAGNPLSATNLQKNVSQQELLNKKIAEFLELQRQIRQLQEESKDLATKKSANEAAKIDISKEDTKKILEINGELEELKSKSLNLSAELNTLNKENLATEKAITVELSKQLRLDADRSKIFNTINEKTTSRAQTVAGLASPVTDLPTGLPKADKVAADFKKLQELEQAAADQRVKIREASDRLLEAQSDSTRQHEVSSLQKTLNEELNLLKTYDTQFTRLANKLPETIAAASKQASAEFDKIQKAANADAIAKSKAAAESKKKVDDQQATVDSLRARKANADLIALNEELLRAQQTLNTRREQEAIAARSRLTAIEKAGTLKQVQDLKIATKPAPTAVGTDTFASQIKSFESDLPKFEKLLQRKTSLEEKNNQLSLDLLDAKTLKEAAKIQEALAKNAKARTQVEEDIQKRLAGLDESNLTRLTSQTNEVIKASEKAEKEALDAKKKRLADEEKEVNKHNAQVKTAEENLGREKALLAEEQAAKQKFLNDQAVLLSDRSSTERVLAAKKVAAQLDEIEKQRLERIRVIEAEIAKLRAHPPGAGFVAPPPGSPPGTPPTPPPPLPSAAPPKAMTQAFTDLRLFQREFDKVNSKGTFFNEIVKGFEKNIGQSVGSVIKFQLAWRLAGPLISGALLPITGIGAAIQTGITYLAQFQERVLQIREILLQNVQFSADVATNFGLGTEAAEKLARSIELASTKVNTSTEVFQQVFESFVQAGGLRTVGGDLQKAVDTVALIIQDLGSVGISLRDARRSVSEVSKLLTEGVTGRDALPRALKRSSDELAEIVRTAREEGNLFEVISSLSSNQAKSLSLSDQIFARLLDKITLFLQRLSGAFSRGLFDASISGLQRVLELIQKNEEAIVSFAQKSGAIFGNLLTTITNIADVIQKIASFNPFKNFLEASPKISAAFEAIKSQIRFGPGAVGTQFISPDLVPRVTDAINQLVERVIGDSKVSELPEKVLNDLAIQRDQLVANLEETNKQVIEKGIELENASSDAIAKQVKDSAIPIFEGRQDLIKKITEIDKVLKTGSLKTGTGIEFFLKNTLGKPMQEAALELPKQARKLGADVGEAIETGLADANVGIQQRLELIKSDLQVFLAGIESNEARFRELTDLRFSQGAFNEVGKAQEIQNSLQREFEGRISEIEENKKRLFGDVQDIQKFNDAITQTNKDIVALSASVEELDKRRTHLSLASTKASQAEILGVNEQLARARDALANVKAEQADLFEKRRQFPELEKPKDVAEKELNALQELELKAQRERQIAQFKSQHDVNLVLRARHEAFLKDDIDATKEALRHSEELFQESNKVRVVDESETIKELTKLRKEAIQKELNDLERERKTAAAVSIPRQAQLTIQIAKLTREATRIDQKAAIELAIAVDKKLALERAFQDKRVEFAQEAKTELLQIQVQEGNALERALIDAQEALILRRHTDAQEALDQDIGLAKRTAIALKQPLEKFDESGEFARRQQELDDERTKALILNSKSRVIALRNEAEQIQAIAVERLKIEQQGFEQLIAIQEQGTLSNDQLLKNQVDLSKSAHLVADAELRLAEVQLKRFQDEQALLDINVRNIAALRERENAVEALRQAELRAAIVQRQAERRKTAGTGKRALEDLTGLDLTAIDAAREVVVERINSVKVAIESATEQGLGPNVLDPLRKTLAQLNADFEHLRESGLAKFGKGVLSVVNQLQNAVSAVIQGFQSGGVGGAIGAGISQFAQIFPKLLKAGGPIVEAAGAVVSLIAAAFTAAARRLAEKIKKAFDKTLEAFHDQTITLGKTIGELERQRIEAIQRLSGKKGGKKELEALLPEFDRAIKDLVKQQKEIQDTFEDDLGALRLGNDALRDFSKSWDDVNKKVQEYIDSFKEGEFTLEKQQNAVEFLSRSLGQLREDLIDQLGDAEKEAIANALDLNKLLEDRAKLLKEIADAQEEFNKAQFELLTSDAIEARVAGVVDRGNKIVALRKKFEEDQAERKLRLADLNREIAAKQRQFLIEKDIFKLVNDRTALLNRQNVLQEQSLDRQVQKYKDMQFIIDNIRRDAEGNFFLAPALQGSISPRITNVVVGPPQISIVVNNSGGPINPNEILDPLTSFFNDSSRFGFNTG